MHPLNFADSAEADPAATKTMPHTHAITDVFIAGLFKILTIRGVLPAQVVSVSRPLKIVSLITLNSQAQYWLLTYTRKPLAWLIDELGLPVGAEALRLRAKAEGWAKPVGMVGKEKSKVGKPKHEKDGPSLDHDDFELIRST